MSASQELLLTVVETARARGLDQRELAAKAGLAPETISRAKKRPTTDVATLDALAQAAGLRLTLVPAQEPALPPALETTTRTRSPLADPKWGLAWSNPNASLECLVQNALLKGSFFCVLEAVLAHGLEFTRAQWKVVCSNPDEAPSLKSRQFMEWMLIGIEKGLERAKAMPAQENIEFRGAPNLKFVNLHDQSQPSVREIIAEELEAAAHTLRASPAGERDDSVAWRVADAGLKLRAEIERSGAKDVQGVDVPTGLGAMLPSKQGAAPVNVK